MTVYYSCKTTDDGDFYPIWNVVHLMYDETEKCLYYTTLSLRKDEISRNHINGVKYFKVVV